jgi:hypothetical protein
VEEFITRYAGARSESEQHLIDLSETVTQSHQHPASGDGTPTEPVEVTPAISTNGHGRGK